MKEQIIAKAYAQSIVELGEEKKIDVAKELTVLTETINQSNDLETVLFLDVFTNDEKWSVLDAVIAKLGLSELTKNVLSFLVSEKRIGILPMIFKNVIVLDDHKKGFLRGTIEGSESSITEEMKNELKKILTSKLGRESVLVYQQNEKITAGYRVTVEDLQLDTTLENQLDKFKDLVLNS